MLEQIEQVLDERVRPQLARHGGGIKSVGLKDGVYRFRFVGQCANCPSAYLTMESLVQEELRRAIPQLADVVLVQGVDDSLLEQARQLMGRKRS